MISKKQTKNVNIGLKATDTGVKSTVRSIGEVTDTNNQSLTNGYAASKSPEAAFFIRILRSIKKPYFDEISRVRPDIDLFIPFPGSLLAHCSTPFRFDTSCCSR